MTTVKANMERWHKGRQLSKTTDVLKYSIGTGLQTVS